MEFIPVLVFHYDSSILRSFLLLVLIILHHIIIWPTYSFCLLTIYLSIIGFLLIFFQVLFHRLFCPISSSSAYVLSRFFLIFTLMFFGVSRVFLLLKSYFGLTNTFYYFTLVSSTVADRTSYILQAL